MKTTKERIEKAMNYLLVIGDISDAFDLWKRRKEILNSSSHRLVKESHLEDAESVFGNKVFNRYAWVLGLGIAIGGLYASCDMQHYVSLKNRAEQIADTNHDGRLDNEERERFYTEVEMPFKIKREIEIEATKDQFKTENLEAYIKKYGGK